MSAREHLSALLRASFGARYLPVSPCDDAPGQPAALIVKPLMCANGTWHTATALFLEEPHPVVRSALETSGVFVATHEAPSSLARFIVNVYAANPEPVGLLLDKRRAATALLRDFPDAPASEIAAAAGCTAPTVSRYRKDINP